MTKSLAYQHHDTDKCETHKATVKRCRTATVSCWNMNTKLVSLSNIVSQKL